MGSWYKTCGLSNLHITPGTPTYVFVLEKNKDDNDHCYSTSLYRPLLLPFESEYNDYGGGENSKGPAYNLIMDCIKRHLHEMPLGENKYHDIAVTKEGFNEQMFFDAAHENRLFRIGSVDNPVPLTFTMFRKDVVDHILEDRVIEEYVGGGKGTHGWDNNYIRYGFKDIVADIRPLLNEAMEMISGMDEEDRAWKTSSGFEYMFQYGHPNKAYKCMQGDSYRYSRIVDMKRVISKGLTIGTLEAINTLETILTEHVKAAFIDGFMHAARKTWIPGGHEGSQQTSGGALRLLSNATLAVLDRERAEWLADNDVPEEEYEE